MKLIQNCVYFSNFMERERELLSLNVYSTFFGRVLYNNINNHNKKKKKKNSNNVLSLY